MKRKVGVGLLALLLFCGGCGRAADTTKQEGLETGQQGSINAQGNQEGESTLQNTPGNGGSMPNAPENTVVTITAGNLHGSGVIYEKKENELIILTAAHVLEQERENITITFWDDFVVESGDTYVSPNADLAFIKVPLSSTPQERLQSYLPASIDKAAFDGMQSGDEVIFHAMGTDADSVKAENPYTGIVFENWTYVEDFEQYMMLLQGNISPGMSGGGVFDASGNFLGILCGADKENRVVVVPLSIIQAEYAGLE